MKRWQLLGEVEDSEDEQLNPNSPHPERPIKRQKRSQQGDLDAVLKHAPLVPSSQGYVSEEKDDAGWLQPKVAKTYGRQTKIAKQTSPKLSVEQLSVENEELPSLASGQVRREGSYLSLENSSSQHTAHDPFPSQTFRQKTTISIQSISPAAAASSISQQSTTENLVFFERGSSPSTNSESLPSLAPLLDAPRPEQGESPSDLLSSPLTERELSPPPGLEFVGRRQLSQRSLPDESERLPGFAYATEEHDTSVFEFPPPTAYARRNLRARKDIQRNPYLFDKLQYQRQCRERGLKPLREAEKEASNQETQTASQSSNGQDPVETPVSSSPSLQVQPSPVATGALKSMDFVRDAGDSFLGDNSTSGRLPKKVKIAKASNVVQSVTMSRRATTLPRLDQVFAPLSPSETSSDSAAYETNSSKFRRTPAPTPLALPTPQISSEAGLINPEDDLLSSSPPRTLRHQRRRISVSSVSTDSDHQSKVERNRFEQQRKRIKGVLPASWLNIDLRAQRNRKERLSVVKALSAGSPGEQPQRGIARTVSVGKRRGDSSIELRLSSDSEADSDASMHAPSPPRIRPHTSLSSGTLGIGPNVTVDDDSMENDFIDPMLAGGQSRRRRSGHQPSIPDAFGRRLTRHIDFSGERLSRKRTVSSTIPGNNRDKPRRPRRARPKAPQFSIADALQSPLTEKHDQPAFVRLAIRRARQHPNQGRHSPTNKLIRLATADDTEQASSVLRAWREGTIGIRLRQRDLMSDNVETSGPDPESNAELMLSPDFATNMHQHVFPTPAVKRTKVTRAGPAVARKPRLRRTQLESILTRSQQPSGPIQARDRTVAQQRRIDSTGQPLGASRLRLAQLETLEQEFDRDHRSALFERRIQCLTENVTRSKHRARTSGLPLERFLEETGMSPEPRAELAHVRVETSIPDPTTDCSRVVSTIPRRPRKSLAQRIDAGADQYRQPSEPNFEQLALDEPTEISTDPSAPVLQGLGAFGTAYPVDFNVQPFDLGTFFRHNTFIGSGELNDALNVNRRDLDHRAGSIRVQINDKVLQWDAWNEEVAAQFMAIPSIISEALQTLADAIPAVRHAEQRHIVDVIIDDVLRSTVRFCSKCIYFVDSIDRQSCLDSLQRLVGDLSNVVAEHSSVDRGILVRILQFQTVLAKEASLISDHVVIPTQRQKHMEDLLIRSGRELSKYSISGHLDDLALCYERSFRISAQETGIQENALTLSSLVILNNCLNKPSHLQKSFWEAVNLASDAEINMFTLLGDFDKVWHDMFILLPALEIDSNGSVNSESRLLSIEQDWSLVEILVSRVLDLYEPSSHVRGFTVNNYVRALFARCLCLVNQWGWRKCDPALRLLHDFFTKRSLGLLRIEESRGSPKFLEQLSSRPTFEILPDDRSFHIFLKLLASGIQGMREYCGYSDKQIHGIAWRYVPNHGRAYRKDAELECSDLDALRNHFDLLCTLYYVMPPGYRISIDTPRHLIDHASSHREACCLSVRAWANMTSFQISTFEPAEDLLPCVEWFADILKATLSQYRLARSEAERAKSDADDQGIDISSHTLEEIVAENQQQIAKTLVTALAGLKRALQSSSSLRLAKVLVEGSYFWSVFDAFDPSQHRLLSTTMEALKVIETALDVEERFNTPSLTDHLTSDDSQDFGDSSALHEYVAAQEPIEDLKLTLSDHLVAPIWHFLSSVFGADRTGDDTLLQTTIDIWIRMAGITVGKSSTTWTSYVDEYGTTSWNQLRDTAQRRKFTAYFMSRVIQKSSSDEDIRQRVVTSWLLSLVERESMLKFQHTLTAALLNFCRQEPLLRDLPLAKNDRSGKYETTLDEIRQRRTSLIASVLCNMREDFDHAVRWLPSRREEVRSLYKGMLKRLMQAMKHNYQELQANSSAAVADSNVHGAYVEFVQDIVSLLQQHSSGICEIDRFFTDSTAFPLPATDPTYVVGRLRSYTPKLGEANTRIQLVTFIQTVSERAAVDGQQQYLISQLVDSVKGVHERGEENAPSLRHVLLVAVFPAYFQVALSNACSWIPAIPMLRACEQILPNLLYSVDIAEDNSVLAVADTILALLDSINRQCDAALEDPARVELAYVLKMLAAMLRVGMSCFTVASFIQRSTTHGASLVYRLRMLRSQSLGLTSLLKSSEQDEVFEDRHVDNMYSSSWPDTRRYAERQVNDTINKNWYTMDGRYFIRRGNSSRELAVQLGDSETERAGLLHVIARFQTSYEAIFDRRGRRQQLQRGHNSFLQGVII